MTERRAWSLLAVALALLMAGAYLVRGNHYAHLHRQIRDSYAQYLQDWDQEVRAAFAASRWELHVQGREQPLHLQPRAISAKRPGHPKTTAAASAGTSAGDSDGDDAFENGEGSSRERGGTGPSTPGGGGGGSGPGEQRPRRRAAAATLQPSPSLLEFRLEGLMEALHPAQVPPMDLHTATHSRLWRPMGQELQRPVAMWLTATDKRTGAVSKVPLGQVVFAREATVPAGSQGRCVYEERGVWQEDGTCSVQEYLGGLCVKVSREPATGAFAADSSTGGGPGCGPQWGWQLGQWRRLDERRSSVHGRLYLPNAARNATVVTVRHARDPAILESDMVRRLAPNVEQQILFHAIGLAMCFLGLVLLLSVAAFATPALARRAAAVWCAVRGRRPGRRSRGRGTGYGGATADKDSDDEAL